MSSIDKIRQIVNKYRAEQKLMLDAIPEFERMGISVKVTQLEGQVKAIGDICCELEEILRER